MKKKLHLDDVLKGIEKSKKSGRKSFLQEELISGKINVEKKVKSITLRLPEALLNGIKDDAGREGIGYQTLIGCILHKYHHGTLIDVNNLKNAITNI